MSGLQILVSALAAAGLVLSGALYALFFALGKLRGASSLRSMALLAYAALVACTFLLANALELGGAWWWLVPVLLVGYLLAPGAIWRLTVATHGAPTGSDAQHPEL